MQIPRLIVHEYLQSLGVPGLAGLVMLVVALTWGLGGLLPGWQSLQQLSQQTQEATEYLACARGLRLLRESALELVEHGRTTLEEINRVTFIA